MATIRNTRDKLLQAQNPRNLNPSIDKNLFLVTDTPVFNVSNSNVGSPAVINFTAKPLNIFGTVSFSVTSGTATLTGTGNSRTLAYTDMVSDIVTVTASITYQGITYIALSVVSKVKQGTNGLTNAIVYAYQRSSVAPTLTPGAVTYSFQSASITSPVGDDLANGWKKTIPTGTDPLYVVAASASGNGTTDTIAANEWSGAALLAANGENGSDGDNGTNGVDGLNSATVYIYQRTLTNVAPAKPSNNVTYTFSTATSTGLNNGWSSSIPSGTGAYLFVTTATAVANTATDTILPGEWASVQPLAINGSNGAAGAQGVSARVAYVLVNSSSLNTTPSSATVSGDSLPATGTWGETNTWQTTSPTSYVAGQSVWVSNGLYDPVANTTNWKVPYLANLKVGSLSIITPNLGDITSGALNINNRFVVLADGTTTISSAATGTRNIIKQTGMTVYGPNTGNPVGGMVVRIGLWD